MAEPSGRFKGACATGKHTHGYRRNGRIELHQTFRPNTSRQRSALTGRTALAGAGAESGRDRTQSDVGVACLPSDRDIYHYITYQRIKKTIPL